MTVKQSDITEHHTVYNIFRRDKLQLIVFLAFGKKKIGKKCKVFVDKETSKK